MSEDQKPKDEGTQGVSSTVASSQPQRRSTFDPVQYVKDLMASNKDMSVAVAAIHALTETLRQSTASTIMGLEIDLKAATDQLKRMNQASMSLESGCELFGRYVTRTSLDSSDFEHCKKLLIERGEIFGKSAMNARNAIATFVDRFVRDGQTLFVQGYSRVVIHALLHSAHVQKKHFTVFVAEGRPNCSGYATAKALKDAGIPVVLVPDTAVAALLGDVDFVLMGAEAVVESGGIISRVGSLQVAMLAKALSKPVYVLAESYKFARVFPLTQKDVPQSQNEVFVPVQVTESGHMVNLDPTTEVRNISSDYTPPRHIDLLFTDLGILTPSAVSDELIKLYL